MHSISFGSKWGKSPSCLNAVNQNDLTVRASIILMLYVPVNIFQLCRDGSSCVEPVLSKDKCVFLNAVEARSRGPSVSSQALYHRAPLTCV